MTLFPSSLSQTTSSLSIMYHPPPSYRYPHYISVPSSQSVSPNPPQSQPTPTPVRPRTASHPRSSEWIIQYHDVWSRLTLSPFFQDLESYLSPTQFARWLLDRTNISMAILKAATRLSLTLGEKTRHQELPLLKIAEQNAQFLVEYTTIHGFDINAVYRLSHPAKRLVDLIEASTAVDASPIVALTAVWGYMFSSWQAWALCRRRRRSIAPEFEQVARFLSRAESITALISTQAILDELLEGDNAWPDYDKAGKTFEEIVRRSCAVLEHTLYMAEGNQVPLCVCGRKGHFPSQCTFKSHI